jgi:uncharacterized membrane-anchored protein
MTQQTNPTAVNLLNKVPEITIFFWIIKMMSTTIGETGADYLNVDWRLGLTGTAVVTGMLLALAFFFRSRQNALCLRSTGCRFCSSACSVRWLPII